MDALLIGLSVISVFVLVAGFIKLLAPKPIFISKEIDALLESVEHSC